MLEGSEKKERKKKDAITRTQASFKLLPRREQREHYAHFRSGRAPHLKMRRSFGGLAPEVANYYAQ